MTSQQIVEACLSTHCIKNLGCGCYGTAFFTSENTVAKVTSSDSEVRLMYLKYTNNNFNGQLKGLEKVCNVYGIWKYQNIWIIEKEYIPDRVPYETEDDWSKLDSLSDELEDYIRDIHIGNVGCKNGEIYIFDAHLSKSFNVNIDDIPSIKINFE